MNPDNFINQLIEFLKIRREGLVQAADHMAEPIQKELSARTFEIDYMIGILRARRIPDNGKYGEATYGD